MTDTNQAGWKNQLFTLTMLTIAQLSELKQLTGLNRSALVRRAVEELWTRLTTQEEPIS